MAVLAEQVAALRALLSGDVTGHLRLLAQLDPTAADTGYTQLLDAGFFVAVTRRFRNTSPTTDVTAFVATARSRSDPIADAIDPTVAERMIRHALAPGSGDGNLDDLDDGVLLTHQNLLTAALVADAHYDETALDEFLAKARHLADVLVDWPCQTRSFDGALEGPAKLIHRPG